MAGVFTTLEKDMNDLIDFGYVSDLTHHNMNTGPRFDPVTRFCTTHLVDPLGCPRRFEQIDGGMEEAFE